MLSKPRGIPVKAIHCPVSVIGQFDTFHERQSCEQLAKWRNQTFHMEISGADLQILRQLTRNEIHAVPALFPEIAYDSQARLPGICPTGFRLVHFRSNRQEHKGPQNMLLRFSQYNGCRLANGLRIYLPMGLQSNQRHCKLNSQAGTLLARPQGHHEAICRQVRFEPFLQVVRHVDFTLWRVLYRAKALYPHSIQKDSNWRNVQVKIQCSGLHIERSCSTARFRALYLQAQAVIDFFLMRYFSTRFDQPCLANTPALFLKNFHSSYSIQRWRR